MFLFSLSPDVFENSLHFDYSPPPCEPKLLHVLNSDTRVLLQVGFCFIFFFYGKILYNVRLQKIKILKCTQTLFMIS